MISPSSLAADWRALSRGDDPRLAGWLAGSGADRRVLCLVTLCGGVGAYGATIGLWQGATMALYVAVKLPLIVLLTLLANGLINGMLAQLMGSGLSFRQTTDALLMAFAVFALIVGSLSPVTLFFTWNAPPPDSPEAAPLHRRLLLTHTGIIAGAGAMAVHKLYGLIETFSGDRRAARFTLVAWLAGNLFAGAQIGFVLRPIFGTPGLEIEFLRPAPLEANFYESVWWALRHSLGS